MNEQEPVPENEQEPVPENTQEPVPIKPDKVYDYCMYKIRFNCVKYIMHICYYPHSYKKKHQWGDRSK